MKKQFNPFTVINSARGAPMDKIDQLTEELESIERKPEDYEEYTKFFVNCFDFLDSHYPCPSVTNEFDKSIIFNAIIVGENAKN